MIDRSTATKQCSRKGHRRRRYFALLCSFMLNSGCESFCPSTNSRRRKYGDRALFLSSIHAPKETEEPKWLQWPRINTSKKIEHKAISDTEIDDPLYVDGILANDFMGNSTAVEMMTMGAAGLVLAVGIISALSLSGGDEMSQIGEFVSSSGEDVREGLDRILEKDASVVARNVMSAAMPTSATDVVAVALGEGIAGAFAAASTFFLNFLLRFRLNPAMERMNSDVPASKEEFFGRVFADGDYFLTRAAFVPLLEASGIPLFSASIASVVLAAFPYEFLKVNSRRRREKDEEDRLFDELLKLENERKIQKTKKFGKVQSGLLSYYSTSNKDALPGATPEASVLTRKVGVGDFDIVELFSDVVKWIEYDVLNNDFAGQVMLGGRTLPSGLESSIFGFLAALSSQLYADLLNIYTNYGKESNREETRNRTLTGWASLYTTRCLNSAALFGVYETVRQPVSSYIVGLFSGGVEGCIGSRDFNLCVETYTQYNPPGASLEAQLRAFVITIISLSDDLNSDTGLGAKEFLRALAVQLYSIAQQLISFTLSQ